MERITALTDEQKGRMAEWRDRWIAIGLSTERADWERFEKAARECYSIINLNPNVPIIHVSSPYVGAFAAPIAASAIAIHRALQKLDWSKLMKQKGAVDDAVYDAVDDAVGGAVDGAVDDAVRDAVHVAVDDAVDDAVHGAVGVAVRDAVDDAVRSAVKKHKLVFWHYWMGGQFWCWWSAFESFFREVCDLDLGKDIETRAIAYADTAQSASYWWPNRDFIMVCDRPIRILKDNRGRLHSNETMAIEWSDGWGLWMWHGSRVTEQIIMRPETITKEQIMVERNSEVSRAIAERLGWDEYLKRVDVVLVDKWFDETKSNHYELYDFKERKGSLQPRLLKMESPELNDGTRPYYIEPVPPQAKTCKAARRWQNDPAIPKIEECNENPELVFEMEA